MLTDFQLIDGLLALMADGSEWQFVRRGKGKLTSSEKRQSGESVDCERSKHRITEAILELRCENFWPQWKEIMFCCLAETVDELGADCRIECVCYGLGNFSSCTSARYQLAMLLLLLEELQIAVGCCSMYDPMFTVSESEILRELGFTVITENEEGKRDVCCPTLFYLMHCGKALYNNLLWKNWSPQILPKIIVIGNSFLGIQERMLQREFNRDYGFLSHMIDVCDETSLPCSQRFLDVFNDTAVIRFPSHKLHKLPQSIWNEVSEPQYDHLKDLEIIQKAKEHK